jgi:para-nitrobenzyl esterase
VHRRAAHIASSRTADPAHAGLPAWPAYDAETRATMLFDETCAVTDDPNWWERTIWAGQSA